MTRYKWKQSRIFCQYEDIFTKTRLKQTLQERGLMFMVSYSSYLNFYDGESNEINTMIIKDYFKNKHSFEIFMNEGNTDECMEYEEK